MKMRLLAAGLVLVSTISAAENIQVEVKAVHAVTHTDNSASAIADKSLFGAHAIDRQQESFNLDAIVKGEHVVLACEDSKGCESPAIGTYSAEFKRGKFIHMTFPVPLSAKKVTRWYRVAGSW